MKSNNYTDNELWMFMKNGDTESLSIIYNKYFFDLFHYGLKISGDENLTRDCIHDLFFQLWSRKDVTNQVFKVKPYLLQCFRRRIIKQIQQYKDVAISDHQEIFYDQVCSHESHLIADESFKESVNKLLFALHNLTRRQKEAIHLKYYMELEYDEICEIMDLQYQSVRNLISEGIKKMREIVKQNEVKSIS